MAALKDEMHPTTYYRDAWTQDRRIVRTATRDGAAA